MPNWYSRPFSIRRQCEMSGWDKFRSLWGSSLLCHRRLKSWEKLPNHLIVKKPSHMTPPESFIGWVGVHWCVCMEVVIPVTAGPFNWITLQVGDKLEEFVSFWIKLNLHMPSDVGRDGRVYELGSDQWCSCCKRLAAEWWDRTRQDYKGVLTWSTIP